MKTPLNFYYNSTNLSLSLHFIYRLKTQSPSLLIPFSQNMPSSLQIHRINPINRRTASPGACMHQKPAKPAAWECPVPPGASLPEEMLHHHTHAVAPEQCCSAAVQAIHAPLEDVWSLVRRFDRPHEYKKFLKSCHVILGDGDVGTLREVRVVSGLPAATSTERLEILDDRRHVISFSVVGGDHRLRNYRSVTTLHAAAGGAATVVVESYVVDVPHGNTKEETCAFVDTIVNCNLLSLAQIAKNNNTKSSC